MKYSFHAKRNCQYYMCRKCNRIRQKKYYQTTGNEIIKEQIKKRESTEHGKVKRNAWSQVARAIKKGSLIKPEACSSCGGSEPRIEAHHEDYNKPLEVIWLCSPCHNKADKLLKAC